LTGDQGEVRYFIRIWQVCANGCARGGKRQAETALARAAQRLASRARRRISWPTIRCSMNSNRFACARSCSSGRRSMPRPGPISMGAI